MDKERTIMRLIELDKLFCEECQIDGANSWIKYTSENSLMVTGLHSPNISGRENIYNLISQVFNLENISFVWEPLHADVSDDLSFGYTTGIYTREYLSNGETINEKGKYLTIWKKINNKWQIILDIGN